MSIHVTADVSWEPRHAWDPSSVHVSGHLGVGGGGGGGGRIDVVTWANLERVDTALRVRAMHEWMHLGLLVLDADTDVPVLVVPVAQLTESVVAEALRRWVQHAHQDVA